VFNTDFPKQYQDWQKVDPLKLFDVETVKKEANPAVSETLYDKLKLF